MKTHLGKPETKEIRVFKLGLGMIVMIDREEKKVIRIRATKKVHPQNKPKTNQSRLILPIYERIEHE